MKSLSLLKVVTVVGTRPEIIRLSRVIALDSSSAIDHVLYILVKIMIIL